MPPFKLGVITDEISQDVGDAIRIAKQYGLHGLELRSVDGQQLHQISERRLEEIAAMINDAGLSICALSTPVFKSNLKNMEEVAAHHRMLRKYAELARKLDARLLRGFSFWSDGDFGAAFTAIAEELRQAASVMEEYDLVFALESDPSVFATNGAKVGALVRAVGSPRVQALYDPGNHLWDPDGELPFPDGYEALRGHICHIHLKDAVREHDRTEAVAIGTGEVGYEQLLARLMVDGYDGWVVVETHYRFQSTLSEEQLKRPAGYDFSAGGEAATKQCLESFLHLLGQLEQKSR